jgi:two-component system alkaline phosphatase synthesis response regulator PhoP
VATILIVDDESDILFLLRMTLETAGYSVLEAENGAVAIEQMTQTRPDLIITDLMMPVMDGRELIGRIRSSPDLSTLPIILVSANPNGTVGAHAIMRKPFRQEDLINNVRTLLGEAS